MLPERRRSPKQSATFDYNAKELAEARKKKRKRHYTLEQELASLWEKMRLRNNTKEDRSNLVSKALEKMKGKIPEIAGSHVSSRVLQTCVNYAVHLVKKILDNASKKQLAEFISSLHGHVASLLRHMVGSVVVEYAYQLGNASQKQVILMECYSTELQLFKDLVSMKERRLVDIISKLKLQKASVSRHMNSVIQPILEKGIVDHSIIHRALMEYFSIADQSSAADIIQQFAKERKKIIKGMKGHIGKIAHDQYGSMVLVCVLSIVDDTKLITKIVIRELQTVLAELVLDKNGRRPLLQLLHPNCSRYFSPDDLASLDLYIPSLYNKGDSEVNSELGDQTKYSEVDEDGDNDTVEVAAKANRSMGSGESVHLMEGGKKDPFLRRQELLVDSGLAESLVDICKDSAAELLKSNFGKDVIYEVATGGAGGILHATLDVKLDSLHEAIASLLLKGKCEMWAQGHSCKVVSAFLESSDSVVRKLAKEELQPLIDSGLLKLSEAIQLAKEG
ncbi:hypothetical protein F0562_000660 [Nyssa sinensis]|uniref:PUM-HD domain-containing protein n=1 Tax=Nyssa sinensis TaxID=561372 RepID=A0A5J5C262_9ASTE|nr:hypothetical protein F0562_000660 [Nyssa sinensis]